jgi:hypothetical protein
MGPVWQKEPHGCLTRHKRTQGRIQDMQQLLSSQEWLSPEDWGLYLKGWDEGWEYRDHLDTAASNGTSHYP